MNNSPQTSAPNSASLHAPGLDKNPIHLLLVDDEPAVLRSLRALFRGADFEVHTADNGAQALQLLDEQPVDVVISDMRMPNMDGGQLLGEVKRRHPDLPCIVLSGYAEPDKIIGVLNDAHIFAYVNKPWDNTDLRMKVVAAAEQLRLKRLTERQRQELLQLNRDLEKKVEERTAMLRKAKDRLQLTLLDLDNSYQSVVGMLAYVAEQRLPDSRDHGRKVARLAVRLARGLQMPKQQVRDIETAALLHDIGLLVIEDEVLTIPEQRLTREQRERFRRHPLLGATTLAGIPAMKSAAELIRHHHEAYDGSGYPDALVGDAIPLGARIIALADSFQSRLDQDGDSDPAALLNRLKSESGRRFDPRLLALLEQLQEVAGSTNAVEREVRTIRSDDLQPGMVLYEKLTSKDGMLLLNAGQTLTRAAIDAVRRLERGDRSRYLVSVYLQTPDGPGQPAEAAH